MDSVRGDGDGWVVADTGARFWGRFGAAGLLLRAPLATGRPAVLLQHRAWWSHQGGTWALPGGARDSHESVEEAAVREAAEEAGIDPGAMTIRSSVVTKRIDGQAHWTYTTVIADAAELLPTAANHESTELRWVPEEKIEGMRLHPGFESAWPLLRVVQTLPGASNGSAGAGTIELEPGRFAWQLP